MKRILSRQLRAITLVFALLSLFLGCESTPHYNRTKMVLVGPKLPKKPYDSVKLFQDKSEVQRPYDTIALLSVEGNAGDEAAFIKAFLYRAADAGADGLIIYRGTIAYGTPGDVIVGRIAIPSQPSQDQVLRGEAIHFQ